jgi:hypothetical protein
MTSDVVMNGAFASAKVLDLLEITKEFLSRLWISPALGSQQITRRKR